jgi:hypothetical protein
LPAICPLRPSGPRKNTPQPRGQRQAGVSRKRKLERPASNPPAGVIAVKSTMRGGRPKGPGPVQIHESAGLHRPGGAGVVFSGPIPERKKRKPECAQYARCQLRTGYPQTYAQEERSRGSGENRPPHASRARRENRWPNESRNTDENRWHGASREYRENRASNAVGWTMRTVGIVRVAQKVRTVE